MPSGWKMRADKASPNVFPSITSTNRPSTSVDTPYSQRVPGENRSDRSDSAVTNSWLLLARSPILASKDDKKSQIQGEVGPRPSRTER